MNKHSKEIREECIQKRLEGRTIESVTTEYGRGKGTLKYWMDQYYKDEKPTKRIEDAAYRELLKENADLKKENSLLKEVSLYFASHPKK